MSDENIFPKKWAKIVDSLPEFKDIADAASVDDLKKIIVMSEGNIFTIEKEEDADVKLNAAKEVISDLKAPYRDAKNVQMAKIKYALYLMDCKGENLDNKE